MKTKVNLIIVLCSIMLMGCGMHQGKIYTAKKIVETCGFTENTREFNMKGYDSTNVMPTDSSVDKHFESMDFYIFKSSYAARKVFENTKDWYSDIEEEGDDYRKGWLADVCDADVEQYEYLTGNMIILVDTQCISCWAEDYTDEEPEPEPDPEWTLSYREEIIELMRETFN